MPTNSELESISKYVNDYIDNLRMDVVILDFKRSIQETSNSTVKIIDTIFAIDNSKKYSVLLRNPVEEYFFIPQEIDYIETKIELLINRDAEFQIRNLIDASVTFSADLEIDDSKISDECLINLVARMCFDSHYQKQYPEVKALVDEFFSYKNSDHIEKFKERIKPFLYE
jgi:hypothetical protein